MSSISLTNTGGKGSKRGSKRHGHEEEKSDRTDCAVSGLPSPRKWARSLDLVPYPVAWIWFPANAFAGRLAGSRLDSAFHLDECRLNSKEGCGIPLLCLFTSSSGKNGRITPQTVGQVPCFGLQLQRRRTLAAARFSGGSCTPPSWSTPQKNMVDCCRCGWFFVQTHMS